MLTTGTTRPLRRPTIVRLRAVRGYIAGLAGVVLCTLIAMAGQAILETAAFALIFPLAVVTVAAWFGVGPAVVTAIVGVLACDFVFVPPAMAFAVPSPKDGLTLVLMIAVAATATLLVERLRRQLFVAQRQSDIEGTRNTLLSALSHDLRTPLATLVSASTSLYEDVVEPQLRPKLERMVASEAARLNRIVSALFDLTRLQARPAHTLQAIEEVIGAALARLESELAGRLVRTEVSEDTPLLACDPVLIEQVLVNLVENTLRHGGPGSPIEVTARAAGDEMLVEVADRGPGVPSGEEERVFDKHHRGTGSGEKVGLGLGLAICRTIVGAHGGRIWLRNREGGGARVSMVLPLRRLPV